MNVKTMSKDAIVTTYDGKKSIRGKCKFIRNQFYEVNTQCFNIKGTWYRITNNSIIFDHEIKKWRLKADAVYVNGVIGIKLDKSFEFGDFTPNMEKNVPVFVGHNISTTSTAINVDILEKNRFIEGKNGVFYNPESTIKSSIIHSFTQVRRLGSEKESFYSFPWTYNSANIMEEFIIKFNEHFKGGLLTNDYYKLIPHSFGIEFETCAGAIPERYLRPMGLMATRDGSITGFEYVTIPHKGKTGFQALFEYCKKLQYFCTITENESLHLHLGGYPKTEETIVGLYRMLYILQSDIFTLFPYAYTSTGTFKRRNYCSPLAPLMLNGSITKTMQDLYNMLGGDSYHGLNSMEHPHDRSGQHKWYVDPRYRIVNLVPLIWGVRETVEFRVHIPTFDPNKVIYWIFICSAILQYAKKHYLKYITKKSINKENLITLEHIIAEIYPVEVSNPILTYMRNRKIYYSDGNDKYGSIEIKDELHSKSLIVNNINPLMSLYEFNK